MDFYQLVLILALLVLIYDFTNVNFIYNSLSVENNKYIYISDDSFKDLL